MNDNVLEFDLDLEEVPVKLKGKDGSVKEYVLVELDGSKRDEYLTAMGKRMKTVATGKFDDKGKPVTITEIKDYKGLQAQLICMCLKNKATGEVISFDDCQALPTKTQNALFKACQDINGLNDTENEAKND